jgi:phosphohistidine phosphatase SixA
VQTEADLWPRLKKGGVIVLVRHASTEPGIGDPPHFRLGDCATQRNLSAAGRDESIRIGAAFRQQGVRVGRVYASPWCRTIDTARLAFGEPEVTQILASTFADPENAVARAESVRKLMQRRPPAPGSVDVMVTHQVNIQAISGRITTMGEMVVLRPDGCCNHRVLGVLKVQR